VSQPALKRLIDLPGIAAIERGMNLPNRHWAPENDDLVERTLRYSAENFGRTEEQTWFHYPERFWALYDENDPYDDDDDAEISEDRQFVYDQLNAADDWGLHFVVLSEPFEVQRPLWEALGWDVTDGKGQPLTCLDTFARVLLAHAKGLPLQGDDTPPQTVSAESWGSKLEAEARKFRGGR